MVSLFYFGSGGLEVLRLNIYFYFSLGFEGVTWI